MLKIVISMVARHAASLRWPCALLLSLGLAIPASAKVTITRTLSDVAPTPNGTTDLGTLSIDMRQLIGLNIEPAYISLTNPTQSVQVRVVATLSDRSAYNVTSSVFKTTFSIEDPLIASVSPDGRVTALSDGHTFLNAYQMGRQAKSLVYVNMGSTEAAVVTALTLVPASLPLGYVGEQRQLTLTAVLADGTPIDVTRADGVTYQSSAESIASVTPDGIVTALASGAATISAVYGMNVATATVSVTIPPENQLVTLNLSLGSTTLRSLGATTNASVVGILQGGGSTDLSFGKGTQFLTSASTVALVSQSGVVTAVGNGRAVISASNGGVSASFVLRVSESALQSIIVSPNNESIPLSNVSPAGSRQLSVIGVFSDSTSEDMTNDSRTVYQSDNPGVATVGASGLVAFTQEGRVTVSVANGSAASSAQFTVTKFSPRPLGIISGVFTNVAALGQTAYLTAGTAGFRTVDASNPSSPILAGTLSTSGNMVDVAVSGSRAFVAETSGLAVIDVSNIASPSRVNTLSGGSVLGVSVDSGKTYYTDGAALKIIDASSLLSLGQLTGVAGPAQGLAVSGGLAFIAMGNAGLAVVDVSASSSPILMATVAIPGGAFNVASRGRVAFVPGLGSGSSPTHVYSIDANNPSAAFISGRTNITMDAHGVAVSGGLMVAAEDVFVNSMPIFNVSDPANPAYLGTVDFPGDAQGQRVALSGNLAYLVNSAPDSGLYIGMVAPAATPNPPTVSLISPASGAKVVEGAFVTVLANAASNTGVANVAFSVNGVVQSTRASGPYSSVVRIPLGTSGTPVTVSAQAQDFGGLLSNVSSVTLVVTPDPLTTVQGRLVNVFGDPVPNAPITLAGLVQTNSASDGSFLVSHVPTSQGPVVLGATATVSGVTLFANTRRSPVLAGLTDFGDVVMGGGLTLTGSISGTLNPLLGPFRISGATGGGIQVNAGTLTLQPGTIFKFDPGTEMRIESGNSLVTQGTPQRPVVFTSMADDSVGGDTGGDGPTTGAPGQWTGPRFQNAGALTSVSTASFRFAQAVRVEGGSAKMVDVAISSMSIAAVIYTNPYAFITGGPLAASGNTLNGIDVMPGGSANVAVTWADLGLPYVIRNGQVDFSNSGSLAIGPGTVVKLDGTPVGVGFGRFGTLAINDRPFSIAGTAAKPVYFTSLKDDSVGGDTNGDGAATAPAPGDWHGLNLFSRATSISNAEFRFGGQVQHGAPVRMVLLAAPEPASFTDVVIASAAGAGLTLQSPSTGQNLVFVHNGAPAALNLENPGVARSSTFTGVQFLRNRSRGVQADSNSQAYLYDSVFTGNAGYGVEALSNGGLQVTVVFLATASFTGNGGVIRSHPNADVTASGAISMANTGIQGIDLTGGSDSNSQPGSMVRPHKWTKGLPYVIRGGDILVTSGARLDLMPGAVVKLRGFPVNGPSGGPTARIRGFNSSSIVINSLGTPEEPVVITSLLDDTAGGDTNADGSATSPAPGDWNGIYLFGPGGTFRDTVIRYGGALVNSTPDRQVLVAGSQPFSFTDVEFSSAAGAGLTLQSDTTGQDLVFIHNSGPAALNLENPGVARSSTFTGVRFLRNRSRGVQADTNGQLYIYDSTFTGNAGYGVEALNSGGVQATVVFLATASFTGNAGVIRSHPNAEVTASGAITMSNTGIQGIDLTGGSDANSQPGSMTRPRKWLKGIPYVIRGGDVLLTGGSMRLDLMPGTVVKLRGFPSSGSSGGPTARIRTFNSQNPVVNSLGTAAEPVYITSLLDDAVGGDTNGDGSASSPAPGDWNGLYLFGQGGTFRNTVIRYGGTSINSNPDRMVLVAAPQTVSFTDVEFSSAAGAGLTLQSAATGQNLVFVNDGAPAALNMENPGAAHSSTFTGVQFLRNRSRGAQVDVNGRLHLFDSTFTGNAGYGAEALSNAGTQATVLFLATASFSGNAGVIRSHPNAEVTASGAFTMSNTGIQGIDLTGGTPDNSAPGSMCRSHRWTKGIPYVVRGQLYVTCSTRLDLMPGAVVKLRGFPATTGGFGVITSGGPIAKIGLFNTSSARVHSFGTPEEPVTITSLLDDTAGGDTNGDGSATTPAPGDWNGLEWHFGSTVTYTRVRYGGATVNGQPSSMFYASGATVAVTASEFTNAAGAGLYLESASHGVLYNSVFTGNLDGIRLFQSSGEARNSVIAGNSGFGVNNQTPAIRIIDARDNWWGSASGPSHASNPGGTGNAVTNGVLFTPFLTSPP